MTVEMISLSISLKGMWWNWDSNLQPLDLQSDVLPTVLWSLAIWAVPCEKVRPYADSEGPDQPMHLCSLIRSLSVH